MNAKEEHDFLVEVLQGHMPAVDFCENLFRISQIWDDLVDADKPVPAERVNEAFWRALITVNENPFYFKHAQELQPLIRAAIADWLDANAMEREPDAHWQDVAFTLRDSVSAIVIHCAYIIGGYHLMRDVSMAVRKRTYDEPLAAYKAKLKEASDVR